MKKPWLVWRATRFSIYQKEPTVDDAVEIYAETEEHAVVKMINIANMLTITGNYVVDVKTPLSQDNQVILFNVSSSDTPDKIAIIKLKLKMVNTWIAEKVD